MQPDYRELPQAVSEAVDSQPTAVRRQKPPDFAGIRAAHPKAYKPWTTEEDNQLRDEVAGKLGVSLIATNHKRPKSAIRSRMKQICISDPT